MCFVRKRTHAACRTWYFESVRIHRPVLPPQPRPLITDMNWTIEKNESPAFIRVVTHGDFSSDDLEKMFTALFAHETWRQGIAVLMDNRDINVADVQSHEIMHAADSLLSFNKEFAFTRVAVIYNSPESLEAAKSLGRITETRSTARVKRFLEEESALDWLWPSADPPGTLFVKSVMLLTVMAGAF